MTELSNVTSPFSALQLNAERRSDHESEETLDDNAICRENRTHSMVSILVSK